MIETEFGPGHYAWTPAEIPSAPLLEQNAVESIDVTLGADNNDLFAEYAIRNETDGVWISAEGGGSETPVWRTRTEWGTVRATGLEPFTTYSFHAQARSGDGAETGDGPSASFTVRAYVTEEVALEWEVMKATSTITAPAFMADLPTGVSIAGKSMNDFGFNVDRITGLDLARVVPDEEYVPGGHSWRLHDEYFAPKRFILEGFVHGATPDDLRLRLSYLKSFLATFEGNPWRSSAPVILERTDMSDRHWRVYYEAVDLVETVGKRTLSTSARVRITLKSPEPFAFSNNVVRVTFTPGDGAFQPLDLGNAPSEAVYVIKGASVNPSFSVGDMVFLCDFSRGLVFLDVENEEQTGAFSPPEGEAASIRTTETGFGVLVSGGVTVSYTACGNPSDGAWVVVIEPEWQSTARADDAVVFEHRADEDNFIRILWDGAGQQWVFLKRSDGEEAAVASGMQVFTAGTRIILGVTYDASNAGGMKIYVDGVQEGVGGDITVLQQAPEHITLHSYDGNLQPDAVFDLVAGWSRMLSADEMARIAVDPEAIHNRNTTVSYSGTLAEGDYLTLDSEEKTAVLLDVSEGDTINALGSVSGDIPALVPGRRRIANDGTQTVIRCKNAAGAMEIRYRRRYL